MLIVCFLEHWTELKVGFREAYALVAALVNESFTSLVSHRVVNHPSALAAPHSSKCSEQAPRP